MMLFNFCKAYQVKTPKWFWLILLILWFLILKNGYAYFHNPLSVSQKPLKTFHPNLRMFQVIESLSAVEFKNCLIKKIEIYPHEILIFGKGFHEKVVGILTKQFKEIVGTSHLEVKQWDYINEGKWRFILGVVY